MTRRRHAPNGASLRWLREAVATRDRTECWIWPFGLGNGYGYLRRDGGSVKAVHVALELDGRQRPPAPADQSLHSCDVRACVNPAHLRWGTKAANNREAAERGRTCRGEDRPQSTLTEASVQEIRRRVAGGEKQRDVAAAFGVLQPTVSRIVRGERWAHVQ